MHSVVALSLAAMAAAAPLSGLPSTSGASSSYSGSQGSQGEKRGGQKYTANFDDLDTNIVAGLGVTGSEINQYDGLDYTGFIVAAPLGVGLQPESEPNVIVYGGLISTLLGTLGLENPGAPTISAEYLGSNVDSFDLKSFYFGCETGLPAVGVPQSCVVTARGFRGGNEVAEQSFDYNAPAVAIIDDLTKATLGRDFTNLDYVRFSSVVSGVGVQLTLVTVLDDLQYVVYPTKNYEGYGQKGGEQSYGAEKNSTSHGW